MCKSIWIFVAFLFTHVCCLAQRDGINVEWANDTAWYVNPDFNPYFAPDFEQEFSFSQWLGSEYTVAKLHWGDNTAVVTWDPKDGLKKIHKYVGAGIYELKVELYKVSGSPLPDTVFHKVVMNRGLEAEFKVEQNYGQCMEGGGDTVLVFLTSRNNPPGTKYKIIIDSDAKGVGGSDSLCRGETIGADSANLIFLEPTGVYGAMISINMTYEKRGVKLSGESVDFKKIFVYRRPDVRRIFQFVDTLKPDETVIKNFELCTPSATGSKMDEAILKKYQYWNNAVGDVPTPYYNTYNDRSSSFKIDYFWTDSIAENGGTSWTKVTEDLNYVDTLPIFRFKKAGFYKVRVEASNRCSEMIDSLWTDSVKNESGKRYYQVYDASGDKMSCRNDSLCSNGGDQQVVIVDSNIRYSFDGVPQYDVVAKDLSDPEQQILCTPEVIRYKGGVGTDYSLNLVSQDNGCDSTVLRFTLPGVGRYHVVVSRTTACGDLVRTFPVVFGSVPQKLEIADAVTGLAAELMKSGAMKFKNDFLWRCDTFLYKLPSAQVLIDTGVIVTDSVLFSFQKGSRIDTIRDYRQTSFWFDSTGNEFNYIRLKAHNYCGWAEVDSVAFYTRTQPKVKLLRDSVINNDSLCVKFDYPYYLVGIVPENVLVDFKVQGDNYRNFITINGTGYDGGTTALQSPNLLVSYPYRGNYKETFTIKNADEEVCSQSFSEYIDIIAAPDSLIFKDSIRYCASLVELNTEDLFKRDQKQFKMASWSWNNGTAVLDEFPKFSYIVGGEDTLRYKLSNSTGCYRKGVLAFKPQNIPDLKLTDEVSLCLPDTIKDFVGSTWVEDLSREMSLFVYHSKLDEAHLINGPGGNNEYPLTSLLKDTLSLIYVLKNERVDTVFAQGCLVKDTVDLFLHRPLLKVMKQDTIAYPWNSYDFGNLRGHVDTSYLDETSFVWNVVSGSGSWTTTVGTDFLYGKKYELSADDKEKDELGFDVSAISGCGEVLHDTLILILARGKVEGYKDTICVAGDYLLSEKLKCDFVDVSTLTWEICYPDDPAKQGSLSASTGSAVTYTPYSGIGWGDSVRIHVKGTLYGTVSYYAEDTIVLKINPLPEANVLLDTLIAENDEINVMKISNEWLTTVNTSFCKIGAVLASSNNGRVVNDTIYRFVGNPVNFNENRYARVRLYVEGLKGCPQIEKDFTFLGLCSPNAEFHPAMELCAGDQVALDTIYDRVKGYDKYTSEKWALEGVSPYGSFDADTSHYVAPLTYGLRKMKLEVSKAFKTYNGHLHSGELAVVKTMEVMVHSEPTFRLNHDVDTLCRMQDELTIRRSWMSVVPEFYKDSIQMNGQSLRTDLNYATSAAAGERDSVIFTVHQGRCTRWSDQVRDTLRLYRLPSMISGDFNIAGSICGASTAEIDVSGLVIANEAKRVLWKGTGGTVTTDTPPVFVPAEGASGSGTVTLRVQPPRGCEAESLQKEFTIYKMPALLLQADTVCNIVGQEVVVPVAQAEQADFVTNIRSIDWYRKGENPVLGTTSELNSFTYTLTRADSLAGVVELVAKVRPQSPCGTVYFQDTVQIVLQAKPEITIPLELKTCQGSEIVLSNFVTVHHASGVSWIKQNTTPGDLNGAHYLPGENWGEAEFIVKAQGIGKCMEATKEISVQVAHAPKPVFTVGVAPMCHKDTIPFVVATEAGLEAVYEWRYGDNQMDVGIDVKHVYASPGNYTVKLKGKYGNCSRTEEQSFDVWTKPTAKFTPDAQVAIGTPITFTSESEPADVACKWFFRPGTEGTKEGTSCNHIFNGQSGYRNVLLKVVTDRGCQDTVSHRLLAVEPPVADFSLVVDSCAGTVEILNTSTQNYANVEWSFDNGSTVSSDWDPAMQTYPRVYADTVYNIKLTLTNVAGTVSLVRPAKMISKLEANFDVLPVSNGCNRMEKEVHILVKGEADAYVMSWGDGSKNEWGRDAGIFLLRHSYRNETMETQYFSMKLFAKNGCESRETAERSVPVYPLAVKAKIALDTTYRNECYGVDRGFENKSFGFNTGGYNCEWQFGAGEMLVTDNNPKVEHLFDKPGKYMVQLRVSDNCNQDVDSVLVVVHGNDSLDFVFDRAPYCSGKEIGMKFVSYGESPFGDFRWRFPDGRGRVGRETSYTFVPGQNLVTLTATADGCPASISHSISVDESPVSLAGVVDGNVSGCAPFEVKFYGRNGKTQPADALWDFKDAAYSNLEDVTKIFTKPGIYPVSFRLKTNAGCVDSVVLPIQVFARPSVDLELSDKLFCTEGGNFEVDAVNLSQDMNKHAFEWWRNGEKVSIQSDRAHMTFYNVFGKTEILLKAIDRETGCVGEGRDTLVSSHKVKVSLNVEPTQVCEGQSIVINNTSRFSDWVRLDLGDGTFSTDEHLNHVYEESGNYHVSLWAGDTLGCADSMVYDIQVHALPKADFAWFKDNSVTDLPDHKLDLPDVDNGGVRFQNSSWIQTKDTMSYVWDFGDGTERITAESPTHVYKTNGVYQVGLYVTTWAGCRDSVNSTVDISTLKGLFIPTAFVPSADDDGVRLFQPKGVGLHSYVVRVYDEWGACVWKSDKLTDSSPAEGWDGTFNGQPLPKGLYKWTITALFTDGSVWNENGGQGVVLLVR